jgi:methionine-rich copper-binding protein CopC
MAVMTRRIQSVVAAGALCLAALAAAPAAKKHTHLERSEPAKDSTITVAPTAIKLWFSEAIQIHVTTVRVTRADSSALDLSAARMGTGQHAPVIADIRGQVAPGRYSVAWRTMSRDGHAVSGTFAFTLAAPATPTH